MNEPVIDFQSHLAAFIAHAQAVITTHHQKMYPSLAIPVLSLMLGPKYIRVVISDSMEHRSVYCFIDRFGGHILKAAGWKAPAKNFARGNITRPDSWGCAGPYSVR